ncbi:MAG TPA: sulfotransferase [Mycobacteriales bacterium]|nr:sulfotransferase [Mycobacteriales bacterium]
MGQAESPLRDRMVFLVGAQRSGTNWLHRMLAAHPEVVAIPGETQLFTLGLRALAQQVQHGAVGSASTATVYMDRMEFVAAVRAFCDAAFGGVARRLDPGAKRVLERSPNHVEHLDLIGAVYPDAWIVHLVRDGRDVARSLVSQPWGPGTVAEAAELWARSVRAARAAAPDLRRYDEVRYEDLLADPAANLERVLGFLGLDASTPVVEKALGAAAPAYNTDSANPRIGAGKWQDEWTRADRQIFERVAGDVLAELGYTWPDPPPSAPRRPLLPRRPRRRAPAAAPRPSLEVRQRRVDAFCAALCSGDIPAATAQLADTGCVRVVDAGQDSEERGPAIHELLERAAGEPVHGWGEQLRGDVPVAGDTFVVVFDHALRGEHVQRLVLFRFDDGDRIGAVTIYRFPL